MAEELTARSPVSNQTRPLTSILTPNSVRSDSFMFSNGDTYQGEYLITEDGRMMRHGHGKHTNADQQLIYQGTWHHDKMHGAGRLNFGDGSSYDGEFQSNFFEGLGTFTWPDGAQFTGTWQKSKPLGKAEFVGPDLGVPFVGIANGDTVPMRYKVSSS